MQWRISHLNLGSAVNILWRQELLSSEHGCKLHSRKDSTSSKLNDAAFRGWPVLGWIKADSPALVTFRTIASAVRKVYFWTVRASTDGLKADILDQRVVHGKDRNSTTHRRPKFDTHPFFLWIFSIVVTSRGFVLDLLCSKLKNQTSAEHAKASRESSRKSTHSGISVTSWL